jgi:competence protein ComEC
MLMGVLFLLLGRSRLASLLGLGVLVLFVLMTGASPSVVRAALMLGLLLLAPIFREENDPPTSLALAGFLILLANPRAAANVSFQLSFAAVAGLLLATKPLLDYFLGLPRVRSLLGWSGLKGWPRLLRSFLLRALRGLIRFLCASVAATLGALIFSTPVAALHFGSMPVYGVLTNLAVIPLATLCLSGALAVLALGLVSTALGSWAGWLLAWPVRAICGICRAVARLPGATLWMDGYGIAFLLFGALLLLLVLLLREKRYGKPLLSLLAALMIAMGLQGLDAASASFTFAALDVGQGQCVCVVTRDFAAVTDCGGSGGPSVGTSAAEWLRQKGADRIDALILTHYDEDHVSGVETLLSLVPVDTVYLPETGFDPENRAAVERAALEAGAELRYVTEDLTLPFSGGQARIFAPVSDKNDNAACVSVLYSAGEYDMLVTGDLDIGAEYALLERQGLPPVELYVAGHHGSARSSSEALLETIRPETVFVSVGRNAYSLPSAEALARLEAVGAAVYRTDECGNLEITVH